jgi:formyltetrahydrofolate synthetase
VVPLLDDIMRMPGLPASPQAARMDLVDGEAMHTPGPSASASHPPA